MLYGEMPTIFKPDLVNLNNFELEVKFKPDSMPFFFKTRSVPFSLQEDLQETYDAGVKHDV